MTDVFPEYWESAQAEPAKEVRPVGFLWFLPVLARLLILPARLGPRLVRSSLFKAMLANGLALLLTLILLLSSLLPHLPEGARETFAHADCLGKLRLLGVIVVNVLQSLVGVFTVWPFVILALLGHATCWVIAWGLVPFVGGASSRRRTFGRCLKLTLWSSIVLVPLAAGLWGAFAFERHVIPIAGDARTKLLLTWLVLLAVCWMHLLLRLGSRVHRLDHGGADRQPPRCTGCGYRLTGLPTAGRCPECGLDLAASLPEGRWLPAWATARGLEGRFRAFFGTTWQILRQPHFFRTLAVHDGRNQAVGFAVWTCWLVAVWHLLVCAVPLDWAWLRYVGLPDYWPTAILLFAGLLLVVLLVTMLAGGLAALVTCRFGWRDPRSTTVVAGYAAALFLPLGLLLPVCIVGFVLVQRFPPLRSFMERVTHPEMRLVQIALFLLALAPPAVALVFGLRRYFRALRYARYAAVDANGRHAGA